VIKTTLPVVESSGRLTEMAGYVVVWYVDISFGIGNAIIVSRMGRFVILGLENGVAFGRSVVIAVESNIGMSAPGASVYPHCHQQYRQIRVENRIRNVRGIQETPPSHTSRKQLC
jgi:hypothetical protein